MRITQGYVSKSVMDFPFHQIYKLDDYTSLMQPTAFFGMYRFEDYCLMHDHMDNKKTFWTGQDALNFDWTQETGHNVTAHPKVYKMITKKDHHCVLVKPSSFMGSQRPQKLGKKIYAYCPNSMPSYHGKSIIDELRCGGYEIVIGDGQFSQNEWANGKAEFFYDGIFLGLCLSEFAGGGTSIIEMGLRGIKVVTNVFDLPNCIPWNSVEDVMLAIESETKNIGATRASVARNTWEGLDHTHDWLDL
jgi:hypothetical protein